MYHELIEELIRDNRWAKIQPPCPEEEIRKAEEIVGTAFPDELRALLREMNGDHWLLWPAEEIIRHVKSNREIYPEYLEPEEYAEKIAPYLCFAGNGCGDCYCYRILPDGSADDSVILIWEHELFESRPVARNMTELITRYYRDEI